MSTVAEKIAEIAVDFSFSKIPSDIIHEGKRRILDVVGCAFGGYGATPCKILMDVIRGRGAKAKSSIIAEGIRTSEPYATLVNSVMSRILDFNDAYHAYHGADGTHPCEPVSLPALAVGEARNVSGKELLTAIVLGYELDMRFTNVSLKGVGKRGFAQTATLGSYVTPVVASKLLDLDREKMANAIAISGCHNVSLGEVWYSEQVTMTKQIVNAFSAQNGVMAALLAEKGFTGPKTIIEGKRGFCEVVSGGCKIETLTKDLGKQYVIKNIHTKYYPSCLETQPGIDVTLSLLKSDGFEPQDVEEITITTYENAVLECAGPLRYVPKTMEEAQFSYPYCVSAAIVDKKIGPEQFKEEKINDPKILKLARRVNVKLDPELEKKRKTSTDKFPVEVNIKKKNGKILRKRLDYPKGHGKNPLTDEELESKFRMLASPLMNEDKVSRVIHRIYNLDKISNIAELMELLALEKK